MLHRAEPLLAVASRLLAPPLHVLADLGKAWGNERALANARAEAEDRRRQIQQIDALELRVPPVRGARKIA